MNNFEEYKERILSDYPRLSLDDKFKFSCHPGVSCFGKCCGNVNIFLTPYDVLRMKNATGIHSTEFLEKYTTPLVLDENQLPVVLLKMREDDEDKRCPFVSDEGLCTIYNDRPWSCRMYPLGLASSKTRPDEGEEFCFIVDQEETFCEGFKESKEWKVKEWLDDQDVGTYNRKSDSYMKLSLHPHIQQRKELGERKQQVFFKACYDLDGFREMLLGSSFFNRFEVKEEVKEQIYQDDEALLEFVLAKWLPFALFHEDTMILKDEELEKGTRALGWESE
ncbi:MAG: YkgJ family cysteine cluster protein [Dehalococcoidia bacterium]